MATGLQVFNASGQLILDATHRCGRVLSIQTVMADTPGSYSDARFSQGAPFWAFQRDKTFHTSYGNGGIRSPVFSFNGNTLSWSYPARNNRYDEDAAGQVVIGVF